MRRSSNAGLIPAHSYRQRSAASRLMLTRDGSNGSDSSPNSVSHSHVVLRSRLPVLWVTKLQGSVTNVNPSFGSPIAYLHLGPAAWQSNYPTFSSLAEPRWRPLPVGREGIARR